MNPRITSDFYIAKDKKVWGKPDSADFDRRILAVNEMYGWLYREQLLKQVSFLYRDYGDIVYFVLDAADLEPYRQQMLDCGTKDADLAVHHIFEVDYSPCLFSGAIQLSWLMQTYRETSGCVGRSWECVVVQSLEEEQAYEVHQVRKTAGVKEAIIKAYSLITWNPAKDVKGDIWAGEC